ncbi:unnamed protein product [Nippostrongylus brasiliensis]|uniref:O-acyltransferase (inferred by orthology to a C. elegans protein) n=1 Tax=Nippostrongylus brasiliensis TaxID=27835 RepID=A0A0N4Y6H3_NIPBR|nr:unnamed protein product [Nippostrongylus brasiliensis]
MICLICLFYGLLHSWLNGFAELLRFGDRQFYMNWWNADNMAEYYRNWNLVVHDWLYAYVYRDISQMIGGHRGRQLAQLGVFFLSAAFHEYWFGVALRILYPVMFMLYFVAGGTGMFIAFYGQEWYARKRCAPHSNYFIDCVLPRHWTCQRQS